MRRTQRKLQFAAARADNCRFEIPQGTTGAIVQATTEIGTWTSSVTLLIVPTINGVRGAFASAKSIASSAPSVSFTEDELAGVSELEVYHLGATVDAGTYLTIEITTDSTTTRLAVAPSPFTPLELGGGSIPTLSSL